MNGAPPVAGGIPSEFLKLLALLRMIESLVSSLYGSFLMILPFSEMALVYHLVVVFTIGGTR
jgi:hypothetical protein